MALLSRSTARGSAKHPAATRAAALPAAAAPARFPPSPPARRRGTAAMANANPDLSKLKDAAGAAAAKAAEMVKNADVDSVKAAVAGGVGHVKGSLDAALALWGSYDKDGDGKLTIAEALELLNSKELGDAVSKVAGGLPHTQRTEADIKAWFNRADFDKSNTLSKREFAVMYAGLLAEKAQGGVKAMASAVCHALDRDGDGQIGAKELKALLANTPLGALANMIPDAASVNYRDILGKAQ